MRMPFSPAQATSVTAASAYTTKPYLHPAQSTCGMTGEYYALNAVTRSEGRPAWQACWEILRHA